MLEKYPLYTLCIVVHIERYRDGERGWRKRDIYKNRLNENKIHEMKISHDKKRTEEKQKMYIDSQ